MTITLWEVGGCVRDSILGVPSKDIDFAVEAPSWEAMREFLVEEGFEIFLETPQFLTIRARFPVDHQMAGNTADFVLCRRDGDYTDGRRPDSVEPGTILDDLARRDFTVNAIARDLDGSLCDPHGGIADLQIGLLRCVGNPEDRLSEDALRGLRAIRFSITKNFVINPDITAFMKTDEFRDLLMNISTERIKDELLRCFHHSTVTTLRVLNQFENLWPAIFRNDSTFTNELRPDGIWLKPSMEK